MELCPIFVPYAGKASIRFVKTLSRLCLKQFDVTQIPLYRTNKVGQYFQLKSARLYLYAQMLFMNLLVRVTRTWS